MSPYSMSLKTNEIASRAGLLLIEVSIHWINYININKLS